MANEDLPKSAISSWSGFVYQGKVALYHCLKLIESGVDDFELQLDSTDDFAIYQNGLLVSTHQVKAKAGKNRSAYRKALEQSGVIALDRKENTPRHFHISVELDDMSDFVAASGVTVKFYEYGAEKFCKLDTIEDKTKKSISAILDSLNIIQSKQTLNLNYCLISEQISSKAIYIHAQNQIYGYTENEAAYQNRITSNEILDGLQDNQNHLDLEYFAAELRTEFFNALESKVEDEGAKLSEQSLLRIKDIFLHLYHLPKSDIEKLCQLMNPSERFSKIQKIDISRYTKVIGNFFSAPVLNGIPHYLCKQNKFYLPTSITLLDDSEIDQCTGQINDAILTNAGLLTLLFEYNNLIAHHLDTAFQVESKITNCDDSELEDTRDENHEARLTKKLRINILPISDAEAEINA